MQECSTFAEERFQKFCGYQFDLDSENKRLYTWETTLQYLLEHDGMTPKGEVRTETSTQVYWFNGTTFVPEESKKTNPAQTLEGGGGSNDPIPPAYKS